MNQRLFTLEEALALLPVVGRLITEIQASREQVAEQSAELDRLLGLTGGNGHLRQSVEVTRKQVEDTATALQSLMNELAELGVELKGIEQGLADFPSERDGRVVYLCWQLGEETISYWHELDTGFAGREPL